MRDNEVQQFQQRLRGRLITKDDPDYEEARAVYNGIIDKRPLFIARCVDPADVIAAVSFGRDNGLVIAVRGGGHSGPGFGSCDEGIVIDLSPMKGVRVDPGRSTVRAEAGCTSGDVDHATHAFGLAVPFGIVSTTGVAGLTLGGGSGYLTRQFGLTIDNLLEADVVLADGSFVTANKTEHPDLFWALRGGGGNFGVVTSFLFRAHPVRVVYAGPVFWDAEHAREIMRAYRDFLRNASEELGAFVGLKTVPPKDPFPREAWGKRACAVVSCFNGSEADGKKALAPLLDKLPRPFFNWLSVMPFPALQAMFDPFFPKGLQWYWKGDFVNRLSDEAIEAHLAQAAKAPSDLSLMHLYPVDGAPARIGEDDTPWGGRQAAFSMVIAAIDPSPSQADRLRGWGRAYWSALHKFGAGGAYVNFLDADDGDDRVKASYGNSYDRLASIKKTYDPANLFRVNQNIRPAA